MDNAIDDETAATFIIIIAVVVVVHHGTHIESRHSIASNALSLTSFVLTNAHTHTLSNSHTHTHTHTHTHDMDFFFRRSTKERQNDAGTWEQERSSRVTTPGL